MTLEGKVVYIIYQSGDFYVLDLRVNKEKIRATCTLPNIRAGQILELEGDWIFHKRYGKSFKATKAQFVTSSTDGILALLSSGIIKGIGAKTAQNIVDKFGDETFDVLNNDIDQLLTIAKIGVKTLQKISDSWKEYSASREVFEYLAKLGIEINMAMRIYKKYENTTIQVITDNPYCLCSVWGCNFQLADSIARDNGVGEDDIRRIEAGVIQTLKDAEMEGNVFLTFEQLKTRASALLSLNGDLIRSGVISLIKDKKIANEGVDIYLPTLLLSEKSVTENLERLNQKCAELTADIDYEDVLGLTLDTAQINAVESMKKYNINILTGGPGTGKTTIIKAMLKTLEACNMSVALAAPTGRAAKRMQELTGHWAKTIHRLLKFNVDGNFEFNSENPLPYDAIIIDETSMIDLSLMDALLKAVQTGTRLVLVGDRDQLPSVGAGNVLSDLIESGCFPVTILDTIHRQAQESRIVVNSHLVRQGKMPYGNGGDFWFIPCEEENVPQMVQQLVETRLPSYTHTKSMDIQVLCPTRKMCANINEVLQADLATLEKVNKFRVGDKVMQIVNDYNKDVYNGDLGILTSFDKEDKIVTVNFDGRIVEYQTHELNELELAYAVTIHKSQGSEYPVVIICLSASDRGMLQRNLLYTALTRARQTLVVVGSWESVGKCVENGKQRERNSNLKKRLAV